MAIVSLSNQRVTIYDADGWIMRAPVSSGRKGYETPAGIYAVIQKETEHYSNLYEDGYMVSGAAPPPCNARFDRQDANQLGQIGSHIWLTI